MKGIQSLGLKQILKSDYLMLFYHRFWDKTPNLDNTSPYVQGSLISCSSLNALLGSTFFPRGVHISREISTGWVLISQEISTGWVHIFCYTGFFLCITQIRFSNLRFPVSAQRQFSEPGSNYPLTCNGTFFISFFFGHRGSSKSAHFPILQFCQKIHF